MPKKLANVRRFWRRVFALFNLEFSNKLCHNRLWYFLILRTTQSMKILESKYYKPQLELYANDDKNDVIMANEPSLQNNLMPFHNVLRNFLTDCTDRHYSELVCYGKSLKDFVKCTDFAPLMYSKRQNKIIESESCYFHPDYEIFLTLTTDLSNEWDKELYEDDTYKVKGVFYDNTNTAHFQRLPEFFDKYLQKYVSRESKISVLVKEHSFDLRTHTIKPYQPNLELMYNDDFIPVHQHIKDTLTNQSKGVVLLHGLAGTGKTNYIKWLTSQIPEKRFIFVPTTIIHLLTDPSFIALLIDHKNSVLVLEDCENYIAERAADNPHTDVVASILNIADGMLSDIVECQMICTFNASIDKIDTALLRKGRLIAEYRFKELTVEKCNQYLASIDSSETVDKPMTLAELTNLNEKSYKEKTPEKQPIGFLS